MAIPSIFKKSKTEQDAYNSDDHLTSKFIDSVNIILPDSRFLILLFEFHYFLINLSMCFHPNVNIFLLISF